MKPKKIYKSIQHGYASSDMAAYFGRAKEGVYYVAVSQDEGSEIPIAGFDTKDEAVAYAKAIQADWHRYSLYHD